MKADPRFTNLPKTFWAHVRSVSQHLGYTARGTGQIKIHSLTDLQHGLHELRLSDSHISDAKGQPTELGKKLIDYFSYRADLLNNEIEPLLMNAEEAKKLFTELRGRLKSKLPLTMNKQKGKKKQPAYLTCMVNMLIEANKGKTPCDYDPRELTSITANGVPLRTLARRVDGAFPSVINPVALWEIKEYYHTTTFGSRVADGVYETLLDGLELEEVRLNERIDIKHYLILDAHYTWWKCGRSYLCRIVDMLHMGYIDECIVGKEVVDRIPVLVREWLELVKEYQVKNSRVGIDAPNTATPVNQPGAVKG